MLVDFNTVVNIDDLHVRHLGYCPYRTDTYNWYTCRLNIRRYCMETRYLSRYICKTRYFLHNFRKRKSQPAIYLLLLISFFSDWRIITLFKHFLGQLIFFIKPSPQPTQIRTKHACSSRYRRIVVCRSEGLNKFNDPLSSIVVTSQLDVVRKTNVTCFLYVYHEDEYIYMYVKLRL